MEISEIFKNDYLLKILVSLVPLLLKSFFGNDDDKKSFQKITKYLINFCLPAAIILWINLDESIETNKLTITLIAFNFALIIFNYCQQKLTEHYKLITKFANTETDKIQQINNVNNTQVEIVKAVSENQKYILAELSRINDRIIKYFAEK